MGQIPLNITPKLRMAADEFLLHSGVREPLEQARHIGLSEAFGFVLLQATAQEGKSHASIWLVDQLEQEGKVVKLLHGSDCHSWFRENLQSESEENSLVLLVDDIDAYLGGLLPGDSSSFVNAYETLKRSGGALIGTTCVFPDQYPCDDHVMSRVRACSMYTFFNPREEELPKLLELLAKQRGLELGERRLKYIETRVGRETAAMVQFLDRLQENIQKKGMKASFPHLAEVLN